MTTIEGEGAGVRDLVEDVADGPEADASRLWFVALARWARPARVRVLAIALWAVALGGDTADRGLPVDRFAMILWIITGLLAASIGRRPLWTVFIDWLPFFAILVVYDQTRGVASALGRPTLWTPQLRLERDLFGGVDPTIWLQAHLKQATAPWWEIAVSCIYVSYFIVPYATASFLWIRNRFLWRRFAVRFVAVNLIGLACFVIIPSAPPWAAASCTAADVASHPANPSCLYRATPLPGNGLLGPMHPEHAGASPAVDRLSARGFLAAGMHTAADLLDEGQASVNQVAAMPSLHGALSMLLTVFLWPLVRRRWRPLLVLYPLVMAFSLVYSAEHYVVDILAGWLLTFAVCAVANRLERTRTAKLSALADRLAATDTDELRRASAWPPERPISPSR